MAVRQPRDGLVGLSPAAPRAAFGKMPNARHQSFDGFMTGASYQLAVVEFDDQGICYARSQMDRVAERLDALTAAREDVILLVFVHGWKHDARTDDEDLSHFRLLLAKAADHEATHPQDGKAPRPVLGIFVGWRGSTEFGPTDLVADATFWTRQAAGHRVATGSVRELFGRLRQYRTHRIATEEAGSPVLVIAGHSFGGMIVYSALAQSLIEAAASSSAEVIPRFADLVLLINPAIEGARYIPIQDLVSSPAFKARTSAQLPVFVCVQAKNDKPVGWFFRLGNLRRRLTQATRGDLEKDCVTRAIGFVPAFHTHHLAGPRGDEPFALTPPEIEQVNPFWMVEADRAVVDGHGGIWGDAFRLFLASVVLQHVQAPKRTPGGAVVAKAGPSRPGSPTDLAGYAKTLGPVPRL